MQVVGFDFLQDFPFAFDEGFSFDFWKQLHTLLLSDTWPEAANQITRLSSDLNFAQLGLI